MKQSKVKSCQANGTWESPNGLFYKFEYLMEDGAVVNAMHKTQKHFDIGELVEYEITKPEYNSGKVGKPKEVFTPQAGNFAPKDKGTQNAILFQVCIKIAGELFVSSNNKALGNELPTPEQVVEYASKLATLSKTEIEKL
jgi:hypothetical protein